jgi:hypothetical protein
MPGVPGIFSSKEECAKKAFKFDETQWIGFGAAFLKVQVVVIVHYFTI